MKRVLLIIAIMLGLSSMSLANGVDPDDKTSYASGKVVVYNGGSYYEIVDNVNHVCIYLQVERKETSNGTLYNLMCENKVTKNVTKLALAGSIETLLSAVITPAGAVTVLPLVGTIANGIYDEICDYYGDR